MTSGMANPNARYVIVAAFDHSDAALEVGEMAARVGRSTPGAEVHLVHAVTSSKAEDLSSHAAHLEDFGGRLRKVFAGPIHGHLATDTPWRSIVQFAANLNADLIIVAPHDRRGIERFAQGSIAEKVARNAHCPVLLARPKTHVAERSTEIEPPCPKCVETQQRTAGKELWCSQHMQHHKTGHTYIDYPESFGGGSEFSRDV